MRLEYYCSSCKKANYYTPKAATRADLQMKMGDEVKVNCKNCGKQDKKHLNRITAVTDYRIILVGVILGIISTIALWNYVGLIATITFSVPIFFWKYELENTRKFNSYAIKRL
jgi:hypothetical protein